jgi:hypothetical protein
MFETQPKMTRSQNTKGNYLFFLRPLFRFTFKPTPSPAALCGSPPNFVGCLFAARLPLRFQPE